jgi:hypothetical protein
LAFGRHALVSYFKPTTMRTHQTAFAAGLLLTAFTGLTPAQVHPVIVVDKQGGPGVDYNELNDALQQAPDGAVILVRQGTYAVFSIQGSSVVAKELNGKALHIVGEPAHTVSIFGPIHHKNQQVSQHGSLINIDQATYGLRYEACAGWNWIENVVGASSTTGSQVTHLGPGGLIFNRSRFYGSTTFTQFGTYNGTTALQLQGSQAYAYDSSFTGTKSLGSVHGTPTQKPDITLLQALAFKSGAGPTVSASGDANSAVITIGNAVTTPPGLAVPPSQQIPGPTRSYATNTPVRAGSSVQFTFEAPPGELAILNVALQPVGAYLPFYSSSGLISSPQNLIQFMGVVPASGILTTAFPVSSHIGAGGAVLFYTQASFADLVTPALNLGGGSLVVILDPVY